MRKVSSGRITAALAFACALAVCCAAAGAAQSWPTKPIRIVVMSGPGSGPDIVARLIGTKFTETWGPQVIVDDRPGASGIIGAEIGARAAPDGYTLLIATSMSVIISSMYNDLKFDLLKDFAPVSFLAATPFVLVVHPSVAANSVSDLIALAKAKPGMLRYSSGGAGSPPHLAAEIFRWMAGVDLVHIPYKSSPLALNDTLGGQVQATFSVVPMVMPPMRAGKIRGLGVSSVKRTPLAPELPTVAETVPGYEFIGWYSLLAPARTPRDIVAKVNAEVVRVLHSPEFHDRFTAMGAEARSSTPDELADYLRIEMEKMRKAIQATGARRE
jgi:tripartite-type tricarboxylate transporter receptor subunit TctC